MISLNIRAYRGLSTYRLDVIWGKNAVGVKWDTGAAKTVISIGAISDVITPEKLAKLIELCETRCGRLKKRFESASGDPFYGYPVCVSNVIFGGEMLSKFCYYLVLENKRDIALLGYDFIDRCTYSHISGGDIIVTAFNEVGYGEIDGAMRSDEVSAFIGSL